MNTFKLDIKNDGNSEEAPEYYIKLSIDGAEFLKEIDEDFNAVYFDDLVLSSEESGRYLIFTCSCGIADCGGWDYVEVKHTDETIIWNFCYEKEFHFEFSKAVYLAEIAKLEGEIEGRKITIEPQQVIQPE